MGALYPPSVYQVKVLAALGLYASSHSSATKKLTEIGLFAYTSGRGRGQKIVVDVHPDWKGGAGWNPDGDGDEWEGTRPKITPEQFAAIEEWATPALKAAMTPMTEPTLYIEVNHANDDCFGVDGAGEIDAAAELRRLDDEIREALEEAFPNAEIEFVEGNGNGTGDGFAVYVEEPSKDGDPTWLRRGDEFAGCIGLIISRTYDDWCASLAEGDTH